VSCAGDAWLTGSSGSAGQAAIALEGCHQGLVFRDNDIVFSQPHAGPAILHDPTVELHAVNNRLSNVAEATRAFKEK